MTITTQINVFPAHENTIDINLAIIISRYIIIIQI